MSPETTKSKTKLTKKLYYLPGESAPVLVSTKCSHHKEKVFKFSIVDNKPAVVFAGEVDPQEIIDQSRGETLSEICARFKGDSPIEKLSAAVSAGVLNLYGEGVEMDTTGFKDNLTENFNIIKAGREAASRLPDELRTGATVEEIAKGLTEEKLSKYIDEKIKEYQAKVAANKGDANDAK